METVSNEKKAHEILMRLMNEEGEKLNKVVGATANGSDRKPWGAYERTQLHIAIVKKLGYVPHSKDPSAEEAYNEAYNMVLRVIAKAVDDKEIVPCTEKMRPWNSSEATSVKDIRYVLAQHAETWKAHDSSCSHLETWVRSTLPGNPTYRGK